MVHSAWTVFTSQFKKNKGNLIALFLDQSSRSVQNLTKSCKEDYAKLTEAEKFKFQNEANILNMSQSKFLNGFKKKFKEMKRARSEAVGKIVL